MNWGRTDKEIGKKNEEGRSNRWTEAYDLEY